MNQLFGGLLFGLGLLIMTCSGLCSLLVVVGGFQMVFDDPSVVMLPILVGGIPFVVGFGLYKWGRWILKQDTPAA